MSSSWGIDIANPAAASSPSAYIPPGDEGSGIDAHCTEQALAQMLNEKTASAVQSAVSHRIGALPSDTLPRGPQFGKRHRAATGAGNSFVD